MNCKIAADDYGMSVEINQAISYLVKKRIISKVSIAANESIEYSIGDFAENVECGLHINLTENPEIIKTDHGNKKSSLLKLLYLIYTGQLTINQIMENIDRQSKNLETKGFKILYLDTHHHVHIVPKILRSLIDHAKIRKINSIRCITMERKYLFFYLYSLIRFGFIKQIPKMILLYSMGVLMKKKLDEAKIDYCRNLVLMPLATGGDYRGLLKEFLSKFKDEDAELIVHPGLREETLKSDSYSDGRYIEYSSILNLT